MICALLTSPLSPSSHELRRHAARVTPSVFPCVRRRMGCPPSFLSLPSGMTLTLSSLVMTTPPCVFRDAGAGSFHETVPSSPATSRLLARQHDSDGSGRAWMALCSCCASRLSVASQASGSNRRCSRFAASSLQMSSASEVSACDRARRFTHNGSCIAVLSGLLRIPGQFGAAIVATPSFLPFNPDVGVRGAFQVLFLSRELGYSTAEADTQAALWNGVCYITPLIGGW